MTAPPVIRPSRNGGCRIDSLSTFCVSRCVSTHDDREDHRRRSDDGGADQHRFRRGLEGVAGAVVLLEQVLGALEVHVEAVVALEALLDARDASRSPTARRPTARCRSPGRTSRRQSSPGPCRGTRTPRGRTRTPARRDHQRCRGRQHARRSRRSPISADDAQPEPVGAEVAGDEPRQDVERRAAFARRGHDFPDVRRLGRREDLHQLRDDRARQRAAGDDRRELPPQRAVAEIRDQQVGDDVGDARPRRSRSATPAR